MKSLLISLEKLFHILPLLLLMLALPATAYADTVIGNEVTAANNGTLTRSGAGTAGSPYKLELNVANPNSWSGSQTFTANTVFPGGIWNTSGNVGIGTNTPGAKLSVIGSVNAGTTTAASSLYNSTYNFERSGAMTNVPNAAFHTKITQTSGGGSGTVLVGHVSEADQIGGSSNHLVGVLGLVYPSVASSYVAYGLEGRVGSNNNNPFAPNFIFGTLGMGVANSSNNQGSMITGIRGTVGQTAGTGDLNLARAGWFDIESNVNCVSWLYCANGYFGNAFTNYPVVFTGKQSSGTTGEAPAYFYFDDSLDKFVWLVDDSKVGKGMGIKLAGSDGTSNLNVTDGSGNEVFRVDSAGNVGVGTATPTAKFSVSGGNGIVDPGYNWLTTSDRRLKTNITTLESSLSKILGLRGVRYDLKTAQVVTPGRGNEIGFIAQEVETQLPELVYTNEQGYKSVAYDKVTAALVEAVKEQQAQIEALKKEVELLKAAK